MHAQSFPAEAFQMLRGRFAAGHGTLPLIGDPTPLPMSWPVYQRQVLPDARFLS
jgi:hypothetical protein